MSARLPVRVALLTNFVPPYRLPFFRAIAARVQALRVFIATPMEANRPWMADHSGLDVVMQRSLTLTRPWRHPSGFSEDLYIHLPYDTLGQLHRYRPDVVIAGQLGVHALLALLYRTLRRRTRLILWTTMSEHAEQGRGRMRTWLRRWILPRADALLANGASGARYLRSFGVEPGRIFLSPYATDNAPFLALPLARGDVAARRLVFSGQLVERKGLVPFLDSLARWAAAHPSQPVEFWLLGNGPLRAALEARAVPASLSLRVLGSVQYAGLPEIYAQAGILAFPSLADEWGIVVNEAMAAGLPVLGSVYSQAVEELIVDGETGWTFRPDRPDDMYAAVERALSTAPDRLHEMRINARQQISHLTPDFVADRVVSAIRSALDAPPPPGPPAAS